MTKAVVLLSGGMDSATALAVAKTDGCDCYALSIDYGQRHKYELTAAKVIADNLGVIEHKIITIDLSAFGGSALTDQNLPIPVEESTGIPITYVPARNTIFFSLALAWSETIEAELIYSGINAIDYSGYPDCRPEFYEALEKAFQIGNWDSNKISFHLPYIDGNKETILRDAEQSLNKLQLDFDTVFSNTNTSYNPDEEGRSSGTSGADVERILAFHAIGKMDPVTYVKPWAEVLENAIKTEERRNDNNNTTLG